MGVGLLVRIGMLLLRRLRLLLLLRPCRFPRFRCRKIASEFTGSRRVGRSGSRGCGRSCSGRRRCGVLLQSEMLVGCDRCGCSSTVGCRHCCSCGCILAHFLRGNPSLVLLFPLLLLLVASNVVAFARLHLLQLALICGGVLAIALLKLRQEALQPLLQLAIVALSARGEGHVELNGRRRRIWTLICLGNGRRRRGDAGLRARLRLLRLGRCRLRRRLFGLLLLLLLR